MTATLHIEHEIPTTRRGRRPSTASPTPAAKLVSPTTGSDWLKTTTGRSSSTSTSTRPHAPTHSQHSCTAASGERATRQLLQVRPRRASSSDRPTTSRPPTARVGERWLSAARDDGRLPPGAHEDGRYAYVPHDGVAIRSTCPDRADECLTAEHFEANSVRGREIDSGRTPTGSRVIKSGASPPPFRVRGLHQHEQARRVPRRG